LSVLDWRVASAGLGAEELAAGTLEDDGAAIGGGGGVLTRACFFPPHPLSMTASSATTARQADSRRLTGAWT
jgi:hypothetical protein